MVPPPSEEPHSRAAAPLPGDRQDYPHTLRAVERELVARRRALAGASDSSGAPPREPVGLAFSGGGIRSATFCLGFCQALARLRLLRSVDYVSSVSGGGYLAGFLGALISRDPMQRADTIDQPAGIDRAEAELANDESQVVDWLREHGRYLSPNGAGDEVLAASVLLRNWVAIQTVILTAVVAVLSLAAALRLVAERYAPALRPPDDAVWWWSPYFAVPLLMFVLFATPHAWAYWMVPRTDPKTQRTIGWWPVVSSALMGAAAAAAAAELYQPAVGWTGQTVLWKACALVALLLGESFAFLWWQWRRARTPQAGESGIAREHRVRNKLSARLARILWFAAPLLALALIDSSGHALFKWLSAHGLGGLKVAFTATGLGAVGLVVRQLVGLVQGSNGLGRVSVPLGLVAGAVAVLIVSVTLIGVTAGVDAVARNALLTPAGVSDDNILRSVGLLFVISALASFSFGRSIRFANDSSYQALYGARLARAYLGASNNARLAPGTDDARRVTEPIAGDDLGLLQYAPEARGGPLHIINVTLNETVSGESQIEHRDRKGLALAVGPAGLSAGVRHHAQWGDEHGRGWDPASGAKKDPSAVVPIPHPPAADPYHVFVDGRTPDGCHFVEPLSLGTWVAISGAAVAPGLGSRTSLAFSVLLTLFNVRLGYWWDSRVPPGERPGRLAPGVAQRMGEWMATLFPVQTHLFHELLARFYGPNRRRWYLSDGGHFENTACYELIRRRLPFIVVCDCGQDADFEFADVANLVRKARIDFHAEIRFLTAAELDARVDPDLRPYLGTPAEFRRWRAARRAQSPPPPRPYGLLAEVAYEHDGDGRQRALILFVKPTLRGDEPEDVVNYARTHQDFPHESTGDQYFDEAQWESYRRLGEVIGRQLFTPTGAASDAWTPRRSMGA